MATESSIADTGESVAQPVIRTIDAADLKDVLAKGLDDFKAKPSHLILLAMIYPIIGFFLIRLSAGHETLPFAFPLISGFALIGPLAAVGLYELSRRRELGLSVSYMNAFDVVRSPSVFPIVALGVLQLVIYVVWLGAAFAVYLWAFGSELPESAVDFAVEVLTTSSGWALIIVGCGVGLIFAIAVLTISVVSFPMLLDKNVGAGLALQTSVRAVRANPVTMAMWGFIVVAALVIGSLPLFVGLAVVMPVLGHATWHLYRKVVQWNAP